MTKKGIVLSIILVILLSIIIVLVTIRTAKIQKDINHNVSSDAKVEDNDEFALYITDITGFDLEKLKEYKLPILIQIGSSENAICAEMIPSLEELNTKLRGKAIIKYIDTSKYSELWDEPLVPFEEDAMQVLINNDGTPYNTNVSAVFGYKIIKNDEGEHVYTVHDGDLTLSNMEEILNNMKVK